MWRLWCSGELFRQWVNSHPERHPRPCGHEMNVTFMTISPPTSPWPLWEWDERHPHDHRSYPMSPRTSPSRPHGSTGRPRSPQERQSPVPCPLPPDLIQVLGSRGPGSALAPERQQATAGVAHCLRLTNSTGGWPNTIARAPLPVRTPCPAVVRSRLSGHSGRLWRAAGLTNPKAEQWGSRGERSRLN
jgi:hypothetical protein